MRILFSLGGFAAASVAASFFLDAAVGLLLGPLNAVGGTLVAIRPTEKFLAYVKIACAAGFVLSLPFTAVQAGLFVAPALHHREKAAIVPFLALVPALLLCGLAFAWFLLLPFAVAFFAGFSGNDGVANLWSLSEYLDMVSGITIASVAAFQLPLVMLAAMRLGIVDPATLAKYRRHSVVAIFIVAAIVTPPDVVTQSAVALVLWVLFEVTLLSGRVMEGNRHG